MLGLSLVFFNASSNVLVLISEKQASQALCIKHEQPLQTFAFSHSGLGLKYT